MSKFYNSDYAKNRKSESIIYQFVNEVVEITLEDYLSINPNNTEKDFLLIKETSDNIFKVQDRRDTNFNRKKLSIHELAEGEFIEESSILENFIETEEMITALEIWNKFLRSGLMTEVQQRRFILHIIKGYSIREIARLEETRHSAIWKSLEAAYKKLKNFYKLW